MITFEYIWGLVLPYLPSIIESVLAAVVLAILKQLNKSNTALEEKSNKAVSTISANIATAADSIYSAATNIKEARKTNKETTEAIQGTNNKIEEVSKTLDNTQTLLTELIHDVKFLKTEARKHEESSNKELQK